MPRCSSRATIYCEALTPFIGTITGMTHLAHFKEDIAHLFPGGQVFLYWKTSSSLWKAKLQEVDGDVGEIWAPIYWGLHSEDGKEVDFAGDRPETDLNKLSKIAAELGKKLSFFVPLGPLPFLANGGLPAYLARSLALDDSGLAQVFLDQEGRVHKHFSFFDPEVYRCFQKFMFRLGQYINESGINDDFYVVDTGFMSKHGFCSYWQETSAAFDKGFTRYLEVKREDDSLDDLDPHMEKNLKLEYCGTIRDLYYTCIEKNISSNFNGQFKMSFLGGHPQDIFARSHYQHEHPEAYFGSLLDSLIVNTLPSATLLPPNLKGTCLGHFIEKITPIVFRSLDVGDEGIREDESFQYKPLVFFDLYGPRNNATDNWKKSGLYDYLCQKYPGTFRIKEYLVDAVEDLDDEFNKIFFFRGEDIGESELKYIFKLFFHGAKVVFDTDGLTSELKKRLEVFWQENQLGPTQVNFMTLMNYCELGDGTLITFSSSNFQNESYLKKSKFWDRLFSTMVLEHLGVEGEEGTHYLWFTRSPSSFEMNYQEIRRVILTNASSYKKKVTIPNDKKFAFLKIIDEENVEVQPSTMSTQIAMKPGGSVAFDYGYFE